MGKGFEPIYLVQAVFVALFPYNFVYTLNSITDVVEDSLNKPWRPLPSGLISQKEALSWLFFLTLCSAAGTFLLFDIREALLIFVILVMGVCYSLPPVQIKKRGILAPLCTGIGIAYPMMVAGGRELLLFSACLMVDVIGVTALKDLSDTEGDAAAGRKVRADGRKPFVTVLFSSVFMVLAAVGFFFTPFKAAMIVPAFSFLVLVCSSFAAKEDFVKKIYSRVIWTTAFAAAAAMVIIEIL